MNIRLTALSVVLACSMQVWAAEIPDSFKDLQLQAIQAPPDADVTLQSVTTLPLQHLSGSRWRLPAGRYTGNFVLDVPIHLECEPGAIFDAGGQKNGLNLRAPDATLENCRLENWGKNLTDMNAGVFVERSAARNTLLNNSLQGQGFGIWVDATPNIRVQGNRVQGDNSMRTQDRGNGLHFFAVRHADIRDNEIWHVRDGIYMDACNDNIIDGNSLRDMRYGIHFMFSNRNEVTNNSTRRTRTGYALMQSRQLTVVGNYSDHDENYGVLMNYIIYSTIRNNFVTDVQAGVGDGIHISGGEGKGLFIYNSLFNTVANNQFQNNALGIHLTAGSEDNKIHDNTFINNQQQVKYVAIRHQEWSHEGRGNYWSDYLGWDRDDNGIGDVPYEPNDNVDRLIWTYPQVRLLMHSPSIEMLRLVQRAFPVVKYPGVQDSFPLMRPAQFMQARPEGN